MAGAELAAHDMKADPDFIAAESLTGLGLLAMRLPPRDPRCALPRPAGSS